MSVCVCVCVCVRMCRWDRNGPLIFPGMCVCKDVYVRQKWTSYLPRPPKNLVQERKVTHLLGHSCSGQCSLSGPPPLPAPLSSRCGGLGDVGCRAPSLQSTGLSLRDPGSQGSGHTEPGPSLYQEGEQERIQAWVSCRLRRDEKTGGEGAGPAAGVRPQKSQPRLPEERAWVPLPIGR